MIAFDLSVKRGRFRVDAFLESKARVGGLFGPTGSGKTSLLLALAGLVRPVAGRIVIHDRIVFDSKRGIHLSPEKRNLGFVFQEGRLFPHLSVRQNLLFSRTGSGRTDASFDEIVHLLDLEPLLERSIHDISGGQARLVAVARALHMKPDLLLLDEPLTGLDPARRRRVLAYLLRLKETVGVSMLLVSHVFSDFLALADEVAILGGDHMVTGHPREVLPTALSETAAGQVETTLTGLVSRVSGPEVEVVCEGAKLVLSLPGARAGNIVYITLSAQDVLLAVGAPPRTSARNVLPGRVTTLKETEDHVFVEMDAGPTVWAEITRESAIALELRPDSEAFLLIKAAALRGVVLSRPSDSANHDQSGRQ